MSRLEDLIQERGSIDKDAALRESEDLGAWRLNEERRKALDLAATEKVFQWIHSSDGGQLMETMRRHSLRRLNLGPKMLLQSDGKVVAWASGHGIGASAGGYSAPEFNGCFGSEFATVAGYIQDGTILQRIEDMLAAKR